MRFAKIFGLATLAALALAMVAGTGSASAWGFCKEQSEEPLCPAPYTEGTVYTGSLDGKSTANFSGHFAVTCESAGWEIEQTSKGHVAPEGRMTPVTFGGCTSTVAAVNLPWRIEIKDESGGLGSWLATISSSGAGPPGVTIAGECTYTATAMEFEFVDTSVTGGNAKMSGEIPLTGNGVCGNETMTAKYRVGSPTNQIWPG
jgi:hypothetical protein